MRQTTIFDQTVADRIEALLARCDRVRRGSDLHVEFDAKGEAAARRIAERESYLPPVGSNVHL